MADRYWFGDGGNWTDTAHWGTGTNGAGAPAAAPSISDDVFFDANSFSNPAQTVTVDAIASCLDIDWTGATNTPTLGGPSNLQVYGNLIFIAAMACTISSDIRMRNNSGVKTFRTNGLSISPDIQRLTAGGTTQFLDAVTTAKDITIIAGTLDTNGQTVTCDDLADSGAAAKVLTLGASTINIGNRLNLTGTNTTVNAGTSTIKLTGTGSFLGNGSTFNNVELNGTAHTISGSNTFAQLTLGRAGVQTITFTDGTTQTLTNMFRSLGTDVKTLVGTSTGGWNLTKQGGGRVDLDYLALSYSAATADKFYAGDNSTDTTGNTGWIFSPTPKMGIAPAASEKIAVLPASSAKIAVG